MNDVADLPSARQPALVQNPGQFVRNAMCIAGRFSVMLTDSPANRLARHAATPELLARSSNMSIAFWSMHTRE